MRHTIEMTESLYDYILDHSLREPEILARLREETAALPDAMMQISPEQGQFMTLLVELTGARRCLEVGTFTGYSSLAVALAMPEDGKVVTCDVSEDYTAVARRYWAEAGMDGKIELRLAPALESLSALVEQDGPNSFDFAFIDADKANYGDYYELCLTLVRPGGLLAVDNVLWNGKVADSGANDDETQAIRALNKKIKSDDRVTISLVPMSDGVFLARKR